MACIKEIQQEKKPAKIDLRLHGMKKIEMI